MQASETVAGGKPNPDVLWRVVGEEALLLDTVTGNYFSLDPIATAIWVRLNEKQSAGEIAASIAGTYSIGIDRASADIEDLLAEMRDADIWRD